MRTLAFVFGAALLLATAAYWLGWGRRTTWQAATGWDQLSDAELDWQQASAASYAARPNAPILSWAGHATLCIEWAGLRLLADPVAANCVKVAPRLFSEPVLDVAASCDAVLLTHAHMDHMDNATLEQLPPSRIILPAGSERFLSAAVKLKHAIVPIQWGQPLQMGAVEIVAVPAVHGGWRYPWQRGLFACGYVIRLNGEVLYLAGDTATGPHFQQIRDAYAPQYAVLPIGAYSPEWFLRQRHLNPDEALAAAEELGSEYVIPYHFGTYRLSLEPEAEPLPRFARAAYAQQKKWLLPIAER